MSALQRIEASTEQAAHGNHVSEARRECPHFTFQGPFFKTDEAAAYLHYRGPHALRSLYRFLEKKAITPRRRFRTLLIRKADLDRAIGDSRGRKG